MKSFALKFTLTFAFILCIAAFAHAADRFPPGSVIDITQPPYSAKPDDAADDTDAIQRAVTDNVGTGRFIFFPAGTYIISKPIVAKNKPGLWDARLVLVGESREKTILKLADHSPAFADPAHPAAVITTGSIQQQGDSPDGGGNKAFGNYICDMTLIIGQANPGVIAIDYQVSNFGSIENVTIMDADNSHGITGISMRRKIPGPGLIKNVTIGGFDIGLDISDIQYGMTLENVLLVAQRSSGIRNQQNLLHIHNLTTIASHPAITLSDRNAILTLIDANFKAEATNTSPITSKGTVVGRNISALTDANICDGKMTPSTALLPIQPTPDYREPDLSQWVAVGPRKPGESDDTLAIQRAIDSGKPVVYFVNDRTYFISDTLILRGNVRQVFGFGSEINLGAAQKPFSDIATPRPLFRIDPTSHASLFIEHLFFNAQYPGEVIFENNSPATLIIKHCAGWVGATGHRHTYRNTPAATGPLFLEDVFLPGWHFTKQSVWARQFNPENFDGDGIEPQVLNDGGKLWVLGFKTEGPAPFITTRNAGITELLGAYNYISATHTPQVPPDAVPYIIDNAAASLTFTTDNFRDNDYRAYIRVIRDGKTTDYSRDQLPPRNGVKGDRSITVPLFRTPPLDAAP